MTPIYFCHKELLNDKNSQKADLLKGSRCINVSVLLVVGVGWLVGWFVGCLFILLRPRLSIFLVLKSYIILSIRRRLSQTHLLSLSLTLSFALSFSLSIYIYMDIYIYIYIYIYICIYIYIISNQTCDKSPW